MNDGYYKGGLIGCVLMLLLLAFSVTFADHDGATEVVIYLSAAHIFAAMAIFSALIYLDWDPFRAFKQGR